MKESLAEKLCCPIDKNDLEMTIISQTEEGEIIEALLTCPECKRYYPVIYGVPIMTPDEYRDKKIEASTLKRWEKLNGKPVSKLLER
jgi:uncharacterized protein